MQAGFLKDQRVAYLKRNETFFELIASVQALNEFHMHVSSLLILWLLSFYLISKKRSSPKFSVQV